MRKIKILFFIIILVALAVVVTSNWVFLSTVYSLELHFYCPISIWPVKFVKYVYIIPPAATAVYILTAFIVGFLYAYFKSLVVRFRCNRKLKTYTNDNKRQSEKIAALEKELAAISNTTPNPTHITETVTTQNNSQKEVTNNPENA